MRSVPTGRREGSEMCLAVPLKLIESHRNDAVGEAMRMQRRLRVDCIPEA